MQITPLDFTHQTLAQHQTSIGCWSTVVAICRPAFRRFKYRRTYRGLRRFLLTLTLSTLKSFCISHGPKSFFSIWNHHTCLRNFNYFSAGTDVRRENLTSIDVRFSRQKSAPALKRLEEISSHTPCERWAAPVTLHTHSSSTVSVWETNVLGRENEDSLF